MFSIFLKKLFNYVKVVNLPAFLERLLENNSEVIKKKVGLVTDCWKGLIKILINIALLWSDY